MRSPHVAALAVAAAAWPALAQGTITYFWDINDTGSDFYPYMGEPVINFKLYALMDPAAGFARSIYDIVGNDDFAAGGIVTLYDNKLDALTDDGQLQANNDVTGIESFQLPKLFNQDYDDSNPILLYELEWTVTGFFVDARITSADHPVNEVYVDDFGTRLPYDAITTTARVVVPAPTTLLPLALLALPRRRA